jgi:uncharacterized protein (TIGR03067 family)
MSTPESRRPSGLRLHDLVGLVVGYGMAALLARSFWPRSKPLTGIPAVALAFEFGWLGLAMSGPIVLLLDRRGATTPTTRPRRRPRPGRLISSTAPLEAPVGRSPATTRPDSPPSFTRAELAWMMIGSRSTRPGQWWASSRSWRPLGSGSSCRGERSPGPPPNPGPTPRPWGCSQPGPLPGSSSSSSAGASERRSGSTLCVTSARMRPTGLAEEDGGRDGQGGRAMSVRNHRIAAVSILAAGVVVLLAWGRSMAVDYPEIQAERNQLQGVWSATLIEVGEHSKREGESAETCRVEFDGKKVAFHDLVDTVDARGTYLVERSKNMNKIDFKLDAGWLLGIYEVNGETLKLCLNPFSLPERLGVPTRPRPKNLNSGDGRHLYTFRKVAPRN